MLIPRNSFVQITKITNVKGRINYIASQARQENLYAVYETTERGFWNELAKCNQEEFRKSGAEGQCIEAREFIIALPESLTKYEPNYILKTFVEEFKDKYGAECIAALHHNKRKTNYHIHLIFSERKLLDNPIEKIATRNMFYNEKEKHVRTKKEILDDAGVIKKGCKIISKGEIYQRDIFTTKDTFYKSNGFLKEVKNLYTDQINNFILDDKEMLKVFDKNGPYLAMKKIGKNNPKEDDIKQDNQIRVQWNEVVDRAYITDIPKVEIMAVKKEMIVNKVQISIKACGILPFFFHGIIENAIKFVEVMIEKIMQQNVLAEMQIQTKQVQVVDSNHMLEEKISNVVVAVKEVPPEPRKPMLVEKIPELLRVRKGLDNINCQIHGLEWKMKDCSAELEAVQGLFQGKQKKRLKEIIENTNKQISVLKQELSHYVKENGYKNTVEFIDVFLLAKQQEKEYQEEYYKWRKQYSTAMYKGQGSQSIGAYEKTKPSALAEIERLKNETRKQTYQYHRDSGRDGR